MIRSLLVAATLAVGVTAVVAQADSIRARKDAMKAVGEATKPIGAMMKGEMPYDNAKAQEALKVYAMAAKSYHEGFDKLFPANSKEGGDTTAAPKIWEDTATFKAGLAKFAADATAAQAVVKDEASFKAEFGKVMGNCKNCHDTFRVKKS
jgi:cytochrome c556